MATVGTDGLTPVCNRSKISSDNLTLSESIDRGVLMDGDLDLDGTLQIVPGRPLEIAGSPGP
jgi:hypothetical protein